MRIQIKTKGPVKDRCVRALYIVNHALEICPNDRMKVATLEFFADRLGLKLSSK